MRQEEVFIEMIWDRNVKSDELLSVVVRDSSATQGEVFDDDYLGQQCDIKRAANDSYLGQLSDTERPADDSYL